MKKITSIIAIVTLSIAFSATASAQVSKTAEASATIVTPIAIGTVGNMSFGNLAVTSTAGTVVMAPSSGAPTRTVTGGGGGVTLPTNTGTVTAAQFPVSGQDGYVYAITIPTANIDLTHTDGTTTMSLGTFTSSPTVAAGGILTGGAQTVYVGATLTVAATQLAGSYATLEPFSVTVNYN